MLTEAKALDATELRKVARYLVARVDPDGDERRAERELDREERAALIEPCDRAATAGSQLH